MSCFLYFTHPLPYHPSLMRLSYSALLALPSAKFRHEGRTPVIQTFVCAPFPVRVCPCSALAAHRYYDGSDSCPPSPRLTGLPVYLATHSQRSASNHKGGPYVVFQSPFNAYDVFQTSPSPSQLVANTPPNRVRFTADRQFVSSCSPPHLAMTQLLSTTGPWLTLTRTSTVLT